MKNFIKKYIQNLTDILQNIDENSIISIKNALEETINKQSKIYIIGNGGSASTASHMANDLSIGLKTRGIKNFDIESLNDNSSICTAIANDIGYENIFYLQLKNRLKENDLLIAISCSGNSPNIIKAVSYAKDINCKVLGITGFDGGNLKELSDINFHVQTSRGQYGLVEDVHLILDHIIFSYYVETYNKKSLN
ncbi:sugar isomerase [Halarcobacter ebronensis]|uniref:Sugar isomerase n=1 Tax=Halarcobacter ebronensis TaxID=1462615 RepID=A0A4Q0Y9F8_9BACT|nr:SIS domain-containing protein [Halarcobacter ebronensis]RXJ66613.1 sugar isomerase [Halarcobacter ebronensis]